MPQLQKLQRTKTCTHCKTEFSAVRSDAKFCSANCRKQLQRTKKITKRTERFPKTGFVKWLIYEAQRAGTVEILKGTSLPALQTLRKRCNRFSGFSNGKVIQRQYEISHIAPVSHPTIVGCLHPANLVIAPFSFNRSHQSKWEAGAGVWLDKSKLNPAWKVTKTTPANTVYKLILSYLGEEKVSTFLADTDLTLSFHESQIAFLVSEGFYEPSLRLRSVEEIRELASEHGFCESNYSCGSILEYDSLPLEVQRLAALGNSGAQQLLPFEDVSYLPRSDMWAMLHGAQAPDWLPAALSSLKCEALRERLAASTKRVSKPITLGRVYLQLADFEEPDLPHLAQWPVSTFYIESTTEAFPPLERCI